MTLSCAEMRPAAKGSRNERSTSLTTVGPRARACRDISLEVAMTGPHRRALLTGLGTAAMAASAGPAIGRNLPDITVVGAGAFGAWTALCLRERGARVMLLDSYGAGNARQTSGDETRQIRAA